MISRTGKYAIGGTMLVAGALGVGYNGARAEDIRGRDGIGEMAQHLIGDQPRVVQFIAPPYNDTEPIRASDALVLATDLSGALALAGLGVIINGATTKPKPH